MERAWWTVHGWAEEVCLADDRLQLAWMSLDDVGHLLACRAPCRGGRSICVRDQSK